LLIAQAAGVPVFVGGSRYRTGLLAESGGPAVHLLDDGFQHRQLARDVDIVVLHRSDFAERLLPAGRLREGFSALSRAQIVVMRLEDQDLEGELRRRSFAGPVWWVERRLEVSPVKRVVAFCAIARAEEFFFGLRLSGANVVAMRAWRDHHRFTQADIAELIELGRQHEAEAFVTTEKDWVRLGMEARRRLESAATLQAAKIVVHLRDEVAALDQLLAFLPEKGREGMRKLQQTP
jgi:tetraacyldisaccharide 4'-kinase